jgi:hypothetical protein
MSTSGSPLGRQGRRSGIAVLAAVCALAAVPAAARAAEQSLYAAPAPAGTGDCGSAADACAITTAVTNANALPITDSVRIKLAGGTYALAAPSPTALVSRSPARASPWKPPRAVRRSTGRMP